VSTEAYVIMDGDGRYNGLEGDTKRGTVFVETYSDGSQVTLTFDVNGNLQTIKETRGANNVNDNDFSSGDQDGGGSKYPDWVYEKMESQLASFNGETPQTWSDFVNANMGLTKDEVVNQRADRSWFFGSQAGGPKIRYVKDPLNPKAVIDLRHMLIVGQNGSFIGNSLELFQWSTGQPSGGNYQDYYSNKLGYGFYKRYEKLIEQNPTRFVEYLNWYLNNPANR
jgi:hypothetical protein